MGNSDLRDYTLFVHVDKPELKAWRVSQDGNDEHAFWLPKSQAEIGSRAPGRDPIFEFTIPEWLAIEKGLE